MNTDAAGTGNAGNIFIETNTLNVSSGSTLASNSLDEGSAGLIEIQASDCALFDNARVFSEIETTAVTPAVGNREGDIDVLATNLIIANNSQLSADTFGLGDAGDITLEAATFELTQNSSLTSTTSGMGSAGEIQIHWENDGTRVPNRTPTGRSHSNSSPVVEARGWMVDDSGRVMLVAANLDRTANSNWQQIPACSDLQR
jgi:large exoprotein involved in heme utilization and adhesion